MSHGRWPRRHWLAVVGHRGGTFRTRREARAFVERNCIPGNGRRSVFINAVVVQLGGNAYRGKALVNWASTVPDIRWRWSRL